MNTYMIIQAGKFFGTVEAETREDEDILERLRVARDLGGLVQPGPAADEIERLRVEIEALRLRVAQA